jgi:transcription initiation factor TFIID TATA-box-binding protein
MEPEDSIEIENVVASASLDKELNLEALSEDIPEAQYDPDNFPGLVYRTQEPKAATLVFRSGEIVSTGANAIEDIHTAISTVIGEFCEIGVDIDRDPDVQVQNIVSSADLGERLNLSAIAIALGLENTEYEPEQFPGLVYRLDEPSVVTLLFGSGKVVITGGKEADQAPAAIKNVQSRLDDMGLVA